MTESGKTTLAKKLNASFKKQGVGCIVLDPMNDPEWDADFQTSSNAQFLATAKASTKCALFIDESGSTVGRYADEMAWCATQSRHWGHRAHFITQRAQQLDPTVRHQCTDLYIFRVSRKDAEILAEEFAQPDLLQAASLGQYEFIATGRFKEPTTLHLDALQHEVKNAPTTTTPAIDSGGRGPDSDGQE